MLFSGIYFIPVGFECLSLERRDHYFKFIHLPTAKNSFKGYIEMVKLLIDHGSDLNLANSNPPKWSPLHFAAYEGHADVVGLLVASGALPDVLDAQGDTPESWALEWENFKCAMILSKKQLLLKILTRMVTDFDQLGACCFNGNPN